MFLLLELFPYFSGAVDCLTSKTQDDEAWLSTFEFQISRSGSDAYDSFAYQKCLSKNWTDANEWQEALYQFVNLGD
jgi:hypothetical protein